MARKLKSDKWLFGAAFFLVCVSVVMVYSALAGKALDSTSVPVQVMARQAHVGAPGFAADGRRDARRLPRVAAPDGHQRRRCGGVFAALLLLAVLKMVGAGHNVKGAVRWLGVGSIGIQPSEFAKLAVILFVARLLSERMERINDLQQRADTGRHRCSARWRC